MSWYVIDARTREMASGVGAGGVQFTTERIGAMAFESQGRARQWADTHAGPADHLALSRDPEADEKPSNHRGVPGHYRRRNA